MKTFWALAIMFLLHDTYYYWLHRAFHTSKWLYRTVHALHHDPAYALETRTGLAMSCTESLLLHGVPYALATLSSSLLLTSTQDGVQTVNVWIILAFYIASAQLGMIGHSGLKFKSRLPLGGLFSTPCWLHCSFLALFKAVQIIRSTTSTLATTWACTFATGTIGVAPQHLQSTTTVQTAHCC